MHVHVMVSLLKACKVTVVGIECNGASFLTSFQEDPHQELFFSIQTSASEMTNYIIVDIVKYLMLLLRSKLFLIFNFLLLKYGARKKNAHKKVKMNGGLGWIRGLSEQEQDMSSLALDWEPFF